MSGAPVTRLMRSKVVDALDHVALTVTDIGKAVEWYMAEFDAALIYQDDSWALLKFDNIGLALVLPSRHPPHIAMARENAERYGPLTLHRDGTASVYVSDPWGNAIEIMKCPLPGDVPSDREI